MVGTNTSPTITNALKSKILLMDEPFSSLDPSLRVELSTLLKDIQKELCLTIIFVTHDISEAVYLGDRILLLDNAGHINDDRSIPFIERNQLLKLTPSFNAVVQEYSKLFSDMEDNMIETGASQAKR